MRVLVSLFFTMLLLTGAVCASGGDKMKEEKTAIVVSAFGTSYESTLKSILAIAGDVQKEFPETPVRLAFTSNIIRKIWHKRASDEEYRAAHTDVPEQLYSVKNVLGAMADLQNDGYRQIIVQSTHVVNGEEFQDMTAYVKGLESIETIKERFRPFTKLAVGRPLTGIHGHASDVEALARALSDDVAAAKARGAALVYMGHGNEHMAQGAYYELELVMNRMYGTPVMVGLVEGLPDFDSVVDKLKTAGITKVYLKPLMIVAGDHANNDMAGEEDDSWKTMLTKAGFSVETVLEGLGDKPAVRRLFVEHVKDAAASAGLKLK